MRKITVKILATVLLLALALAAITSCGIVVNGDFRFGIATVETEGAQIAAAVILDASDRIALVKIDEIENGKQESKKQLIIVAIECNHEGNSRLEEYSPFDSESATLGKLKGKGRLYMNWLIKTLKPYIDQKYRTLPDRKNTLIGGSSMGGLMALYGATVFNHVFQRAVCLSPSLWIHSDKVLEMIAKSNIRRDTCIYLDYGSEEMMNHVANAEALMSTSHLLLAKRVNLTFRIVPGGTHSEASWEQQIPIFMDCMGL